MKSLRNALSLRLLAGSMVIAVLTGVVLHWQVRRVLTAEFDLSLRASAQALATLTDNTEDGALSLDYVGENMPQYEQAGGDDVFVLCAVDGREVERSRSLGTDTLPFRAGSVESPEFYDITLSGGRAVRCAGIRFTPQPEEHDAREGVREPPMGTRMAAVLVVGSDRSPLDHTLATLSASLLLVGTLALCMVAVFVRWSVRRGLAPLDRLGEGVADVDAASLSTRFPVATLPSELLPITARLNELLARLEAAFGRERRFTATAAHELRTPLAELRALGEVNLSTPATEEERTESWRDALDSTLRMESLALRLLELARAEDPGRVSRREAAPVADAFEAAWRPCIAQAAQRGLAIDRRIPVELVVSTDPTLFGVILTNLCANAVTYAPAGTRLVVSAIKQGGAVTVALTNRAGDLDEEDLPHLFERFWRKDRARADGWHHGLGLAVASEFALLLGGTLGASLAHGIVEFKLTLPA